MLDCSSRGLGSRLNKSLCFFFLGKTLYSHSASPPLRSIIGYQQKLQGSQGLTLWWSGFPIQEGVVIFQVASCYGNWKKLWLDWLLDSNANLALTIRQYNITWKTEKKLIENFFCGKILFCKIQYNYLTAWQLSILTHSEDKDLKVLLNWLVCVFPMVQWSSFFKLRTLARIERKCLWAEFQNSIATWTCLFLLSSWQKNS